MSIMTKKYAVSDALAEVLGSDKDVTRPAATKKLWAIYKAEGLTPQLKKIVGKEMTLSSCAKGLSKHLEAVE